MEGILQLISLSADKQVQALTLCFSQETVTIVDNLGLTAAQRGKVKDIIKAIESYVQGEINETVERQHVRRHVQQDGETVNDFLVSLRESAKTCKFCSDACTQKSIRDEIIEGLLDRDLPSRGPTERKRPLLGYHNSKLPGS